MDAISSKYSGRYLKRPSWTKEAINLVRIPVVHSRVATWPDSSKAMFDAIERNDLFEGMRLIALGADPCWVNENEEMRTAVHQAVDRGLEVYVEMLCANGNASAQDFRPVPSSRPSRCVACRSRGSRMDPVALCSTARCSCVCLCLT